MVEALGIQNLIGVLISLLTTLAAVQFWRIAVNRVATRALARAEELPRERQLKLRTLAGVTSTAGTLVLVLIGALLVLDQFVNVAALLAGAGIAGLAVGLAAQSFIRDVIGGFFILLEDQYNVGDVVQINSEHEGLVEQIDLRRTVLRSLDGTAYTISNGEIRVVANRTKGWSGSLVDIAVDVKEDLDRVIEVLARAGRELVADPQVGQRVLEPPEILGVEALGESQATLRVLIKARPMGQWEVARRYRALVHRAFAHEGMALRDPKTGDS